MITKYYRCDFLTDIVLPASSNTQGNIHWHDFVPGSNFLGMAARGYTEAGEDAFELFHSGAVRFGDAHLMIDDKPSFKIPLSYHHLKIGNSRYNRLHLDDQDEQRLREEQKQLKQTRNGYFNTDYITDDPEHTYTQKSNYDKDLRRSKDSGMYGYNALKGSTSWIFKVSYADERHIPFVEKYLLGKQRLGKSKSVQYGGVEISHYDTPEDAGTFTPQNDLTYIYLFSRMVLMDEEGNFTATPTIQSLGLNSGEILWEKSYLRTSTYTPFNYTRQTKEYTRVCIEKGSVITLRGCDDDISGQIGAFASEGFGEILVNPSFLEPLNPPLQKRDKTPPKQTDTELSGDTGLIAFLEQREAQEKRTLDVAQHVQRVASDLTGPSKSQWGEIRSIASTSRSEEELTKRIEEYISKGIAKKQWEHIKERLLSEIKKSEHPLAFTKLLAMIVRKQTKGGRDGK